MTITINGSGTVTGIIAGGLPDAIITQPELATGVAGTGPAFSAYANATQSVTSSTVTKVTLGTEVFDTNNNFASSTFTPTVAGYYQINGLVRCGGTSLSLFFAVIYKNGTALRRGNQLSATFTNTGELSVSDIVYMNGTTDYLELYGFVTAASGAEFNFNDATSTSAFSGVLVRGA